MPLYYQLQEVLKEQIESGRWPPGEALPSEPELARRFGVSRVVVRQALAILEDDRQIVRIKGRGTFVAQPKLDARAGGLSRCSSSPARPRSRSRPSTCAPPWSRSRSARKLSCSADEAILRVTTCLSLRGVPLSISYSFFRRDEVEWLEAAVQPGRNLPGDLVLGDHGIELAQRGSPSRRANAASSRPTASASPIEPSVFLALCTEFRRDDDERHARSRSRASSTAATSSGSGSRCPTPGRAGWRRCGS